MDALRELIQTVKKAWNEIKAFIKSIHNAVDQIKQKKKLRSTWFVCLDNRKPSQVLSRKPVFQVRKII
ncbi:hypothetical protein CSV79_01610 [Sporosarcina sp. P13]|uniref:hypothetical protein n=1 Tax=Sporosarcina sp. P13 TaxID=2048263 RepID=UPI000C1650B9|nr:hypothetical protein [Sporosarcina sp. P13]PIC65344.1 hypothetical protein CSV79_01610 [Sporosarcina sp. P13]